MAEQYRDNDEDAGRPLIHRATSRGDIETVTRLLDEDASLIHVRNELNNQPLHEACWSKHADVVRLLIDRGAEINVCGDFGETPLHYAVRDGGKAASEIVTMLVHEGANVDAKDERLQQNALGFALREFKDELAPAIRLLQERGASLGLEGAVIVGDAARVKEILCGSVDGLPVTMNRDVQWLLELAKRRQFDEIVDLLRSLPPMKINFKRTNVELTKLLVEAIGKFSRERPQASITGVCIWAQAFPAFARIIVRTTDDEALFGQRKSHDFDYDQNEIAGSNFDWWPDLYKLKDGERYEVPAVAGLEAELKGDEVIDAPLFAMVKEILEQSFAKLSLAADCQLQAKTAMFDATWVAGTAPATVDTIRAQRAAREAARIYVPKIQTTEEALQHRIRTMQAGLYPINGAFLRNNRYCWTKCSSPDIVFLWDLRTGQPYDSFEIEGWPVVSPSGRYALTTTTATNTLWDFKRRRFKRLNGPNPKAVSRYCAVTFAPDSRTFALVPPPAPDREATIAISRIDALDQVRTVPMRPSVVKFSPDGRFVYSFNSFDRLRPILRIDLTTGESEVIFFKTKGFFDSFAVSPDGRRLAISDRFENVWIWNLTHRQVERVLPPKLSSIDLMAFSPSGKCLVGGGSDKGLQFWHADTGDVLQLIANPTARRDNVTALDISRNGGQLLAGYSDGFVDLWDMEGLLGGIV